MKEIKCIIYNLKLSGISKIWAKRKALKKRMI